MHTMHILHKLRKIRKSHVCRYIILPALLPPTLYRKCLRHPQSLGKCRCWRARKMLPCSCVLYAGREVDGLMMCCSSDTSLTFFFFFLLNPRSLTRFHCGHLSTSAGRPALTLPPNSYPAWMPSSAITNNKDVTNPNQPLKTIFSNNFWGDEMGVRGVLLRVYRTGRLR